MPFVGFDWRYRKAHEYLDMGHNGNPDAHLHKETEENIFGQQSTKDNRSVFSVGIEYILPMLIKTQAEIFTDGNFRLQFERMDIPISKRIRMNAMWNTDKEYMAGFRYILNKNIGLTTHYDSDMGLGFGLNINY